MTREQRGPLSAFVMLALITGGLLAHALSTGAAGNLFVAPAQSVIGATVLSPLRLASTQETRAGGSAAGTPATITDQVVTHMIAVEAVNRSAQQLGAQAGRPGSGVQSALNAVTQALVSVEGLSADALMGTATVTADVINGAMSSVTHSPAAASAATPVPASNARGLKPTDTEPVAPTTVAGNPAPAAGPRGAQHGRDKHSRDEHGRDKHSRDKHSRDAGQAIPVGVVQQSSKPASKHTSTHPAKHNSKHAAKHSQKRSNKNGGPSVGPQAPAHPSAMTPATTKHDDKKASKKSSKKSINKFSKKSRSPGRR